MVPVAASAPEVLAIATFVRDRFDEARQAALDARVEANISATEGMDMSQRDRVRLDCPFLEAGKCTRAIAPGWLVLQQQGKSCFARGSG